MPYKNDEDRRKHNKRYYLKNNVKEMKRAKQWAKDNPERIKEHREKWRKSNSEKIKKFAKLYRINNKEKISKYRKEWITKKRKTDLKYNLNHRIGTLIGFSLKGNKKGRHWESLVGYTLGDLIKRLKRTLPKGYTWQDYLQSRLHIDHIIPKSVFNYTKPEHIDFKKAWALSNLQLLPAKENLTKNAKLNKPFQPALKI